MLKNARLLGALYIALIPVYALIFSAFPSHFIHGNLTKEKEYQAALSRLERGIAESFMSHVAEWNRLNPERDLAGKYPERRSGSRYYTAYDDLQLRVQSVEGEHVSLRAQYTVVSPIPSIDFSADHSAEITDESFRFTYFDTVILSPFVPEGALLENRNAPFYTLRELDFQVPYEVAPEGPDFALDWAFQEDIRGLRQRQNGISEFGWDNFTRMLYFSAVTITTLGYGDIAPVTQLSRLLITSEVIIGIVIIGLFLSAVTAAPPRASAKQPSADQTVSDPPATGPAAPDRPSAQPKTDPASSSKPGAD